MQNLFELEAIGGPESGLFIPDGVKCVAPFDGGRRIACGAADGVHVSAATGEPVRTLALPNATQLAVLDQAQLLLVLADGQLFACPLSALALAADDALQSVQRLSANTASFVTGRCTGRTIVVALRVHAAATTCRVFEARGGVLELSCEFYVPEEAHAVRLTRAHVLLGVVGGFKRVELEEFDMQSFPSPEDARLALVGPGMDPPRPLAAFRVGADYLLCYDRLTFYVDERGHRARPDFLLQWPAGEPATGFALHHPHLLAFTPSAIAVRHARTGALVQTLAGDDVRLLFVGAPLATSGEDAAPVRSVRHQLAFWRGGQVTTLREGA